MVRLKHRYILFEVLDATSNPEQKEVLDGVRRSLQTNFGTVASGQLNSSMYIKYYSQRTGRGILQADRAHFRLAWAALTYLRPPGGGFFRALGVSGTIRKAETRLINIDKYETFLMQ